MKNLKKVFWIFLFFISSHSYAQNLDCEYTTALLTELPQIHFSLTLDQLEQYASQAAVATAQDLNFPFTNVLNGGLRPTCDALVLAYQAANPTTDILDSFYEDFMNDITDHIDPYTSLQSPEDAKQFLNYIHGKFKGLGFYSKATSENHKGPFQIVDIFPTSMLLDKGLQIDDLITFINEKSCSELTLSELSQIIQDQTDSFSMTVQREDQTFVMSDLLLSQLTQPSVMARFINDQGLVYIKISSFTSTTSDELAQEIANLQIAYGSDLRGIILDLRNNPGGILQEALDTVDTFIDRGVVASAFQKNYTKWSGVYTADTPGERTHAPLLILINNFSASASEVTTGALQDYGRALVVGEKSFGKGTVLGMWDLKSEPPRLDSGRQVNDYEGSVIFTTAIYHRPTGPSVQGVGIIPDIAIENPEFTKYLKESRDKGEREIFYENDYPNSIQAKDATSTFKPPYQFRDLAKQKLARATLRDHFSEIEKKDLQLTKAQDYLKLLVTPDRSPEENHFGTSYYYTKPSHRLHVNTDLYQKGSKYMVRFLFKTKTTDFWTRKTHEDILYDTYAFMMGNQLTLALQGTPVEIFVNHKKHGSFILDIEVRKKNTDQTIENFSHNTIVSF